MKIAFLVQDNFVIFFKMSKNINNETNESNKYLVGICYAIGAAEKSVFRIFAVP